MKKNLLLLVFVCLANMLFSSRVFAQPTVSTPVYYCQGSTATALTATPSLGSALIWYGTNQTGGTGSSVAPTPSTTTVGSTSYYVSETNGVTESTRARIIVNVLADNGSEILLLRCDRTQIVAPATIYNAVYFDWTNTAGLPNQYTYSYSVDGGSAISGTTGPTSLQVNGLSPGQSVTLSVSHTTYPCDLSVITCSVPCLTLSTPTFTQIAPICAGDTPPALPSSSLEGIDGSWSPAVINTTTPGTVTYTFTPDAVAFPCANPQTMNITVLSRQTPTFNSIPSTVCQGTTALMLPLSSNNSTPVTGTWSPNSVDTSTLGTTAYTFTPDAGQCVVATLTTVDITVIPNNVDPDFTPIAPICIGSTPPILNTTSPSGVTGTWTPSVINTNSVGITTYTFNPNPNQCANSQPLSVTIIAKTVTNFAQIAPFCAGDPAPILATTSPNGVSGTWFPTTVDNFASASYLFTPNTNECATPQTMNVTVNQPDSPGFSDFTICSGTSATLDTTSPTGVTGTWDPPTVDEFNSDSYTFTPDTGQCATEQTIEVTVIPSNTLVDFNWTVTEAFAENQKITVSAIAVGGDYLYQLDDGPFQSSNVFEYVASGTHSITVTDQAGCSMPITKTDILVINYPKYFTPNNDGFNDYWNVKELDTQPNAYIRIFDRYGKFLKQISPNGDGWNGSYNGYFLPADDYWFVIRYIENNAVKEFKSHFSLKR